jgi:hypothetical protein
LFHKVGNFFLNNSSDNSLIRLYPAAAIVLFWVWIDALLVSLPKLNGFVVLTQSERTLTNFFCLLLLGMNFVIPTLALFKANNQFMRIALAITVIFSKMMIFLEAGPFFQGLFLAIMIFCLAVPRSLLRTSIESERDENQLQLCFGLGLVLFYLVVAARIFLIAQEFSDVEVSFYMFRIQGQETISALLFALSAILACSPFLLFRRWKRNFSILFFLVAIPLAILVKVNLFLVWLTLLFWIEPGFIRSLPMNSKADR